MNIRFYSIVILIFTIIFLSACSSDSDNKASVPQQNDNHGENDGDSEQAVAAEDAYTVVIDPGHGGKDNGATGVDGSYEKEFTLSLGKKIQSLLNEEPEINVLMTRDDDRFISQKSLERPEFANENEADLYLSLHQDSFDDPDVSGTESFYYDDDSLDVAKIIQKHVVDTTGFNDRGIKRENLFVLRDSDMPSVLIEVGYLTNPDEQEKMNSDNFQEQIAQSIVDGIEEYRED
ncbi:MAG TPA: N-acetylmuramoyl-L-alanine amidase [Virgibacillus sp.]|nr:N-acetylmuramoyl-L-alanine amidase [Virgibacillus sp.]